MTTIFDYYTDLKEARQLRTYASLREKSLHKPVTRDYHSIPDLYKCFLGIVPLPDNQEDRMTQRRIFTIIIVRLFNPPALAGYKLDGRVRKELAKVFGCTPSAVSHIFRHLMFWFESVSSFREETEQVFRRIVEEKQLPL